MVLVDTSIWIAHLRDGLPELARLLADGDVVVHPFVIGEIAGGSLRNRKLVLRLLGELPRRSPAHHDEVLALLHKRKLHNRGVGWIDLHLAAAAMINGDALWTADRRLARIASELGIPHR